MPTGKGPTASANFLRLLYQAVAWGNVADDSASRPLDNIFYGMNISAPTGGDQSKGEAIYPGYARQAVARSRTGHVYRDGAIYPASAILFPKATSAGEVLTHFHTGRSKSGAGEVFHYGEIEPQIYIVPGAIPELGSETAIEEG